MSAICRRGASCELPEGVRVRALATDGTRRPNDQVAEITNVPFARIRALPALSRVKELRR